MFSSGWKAGIGTGVMGLGALTIFGKITGTGVGGVTGAEIEAAGRCCLTGELVPQDGLDDAFAIGATTIGAITIWA
jgi:hypothetical protein